MAAYEIDVASGCARVSATDRVEIQLGGPDGSVVLDVTNEAAHQLLSQLRRQLKAESISRRLHNAVIATRMQASA